VADPEPRTIRLRGMSMNKREALKLKPGDHVVMTDGPPIYRVARAVCPGFSVSRFKSFA
jgi:hypothetical protein